MTHRGMSGFPGVSHESPAHSISPWSWVAVAPFLVQVVCSPFRPVLAQGMLAVKY